MITKTLLNLIIKTIEIKNIKKSFRVRHFCFYEAVIISNINQIDKMLVGYL